MCIILCVQVNTRNIKLYFIISFWIYVDISLGYVVHREVQGQVLGGGNALCSVTSD